MMKKSGTIFMTIALTLLSVLGGTIGTVRTVYAAENALPTNEYFVEASNLMDGYNLNGGAVAKIKFGQNQRWAICGKDGDDLALLMISPTGVFHYHSSNESPENFGKYSCSYFVKSITNDSYSDFLVPFSLAERNKLKDVTVKTIEDGQGATRENDGTSVTAKLYLPDASGKESEGDDAIYVGSNTDIKVNISTIPFGPSNILETVPAWLRTYIEKDNSSIYVAVIGTEGKVTKESVQSFGGAIQPACNLDMSTVLFASSADAATGDGGELQNEANVFTLRYLSEGPESVIINEEGSDIKIKNATDNMYLVVQKREGAYAKKLNNGTNRVSANDMEFDNFNNCEVWVESTTDRITTAKRVVRVASDEFDHDDDVDEPTMPGNDDPDNGNPSVASTTPTWAALMLDSMSLMINAKEDDTIIVDGRESGLHSFSLGFIKTLAAYRKANIIMRYQYEGVEYEITIPAGAKITVNENISWYGPLFIASGALGKDVNCNIITKQ